ncbi:MAG TPA: hypothetical protein VF070_00310 [Streptosporangiaceae bacterium]
MAAHQMAGKTPEQQAAISAAAMLAAFVPPPRAVRTGPLPVCLLSQPGYEPLTADQVTRTGWWRVASHPQAVLAWIQAHKPPGSTYSGTGGVTQAGSYVVWDVQFDLPPVPGVLPGRELEVTLAADGPDRTGLRTDAFVDWQPVRSAAETIPASAPGGHDHPGRRRGFRSSGDHRRPGPGRADCGCGERLARIPAAQPDVV